MVAHAAQSRSFARSSSDEIVTMCRDKEIDLQQFDLGGSAIHRHLVYFVSDGLPGQLVVPHRRPDTGDLVPLIHEHVEDRRAERLLAREDHPHRGHPIVDLQAQLIFHAQTTARYFCSSFEAWWAKTYRLPVLRHVSGWN